MAVIHLSSLSELSTLLLAENPLLLTLGERLCIVALVLR